MGCGLQGGANLAGAGLRVPVRVGRDVEGERHFPLYGFDGAVSHHHPKRGAGAGGFQFAGQVVGEFGFAHAAHAAHADEARLPAAVEGFAQVGHDRAAVHKIPDRAGEVAGRAGLLWFRRPLDFRQRFEQFAGGVRQVGGAVEEEAVFEAQAVWDVFVCGGGRVKGNRDDAMFAVWVARHVDGRGDLLPLVIGAFDEGGIRITLIRACRCAFLSSISQSSPSRRFLLSRIVRACGARCPYRISASTVLAPAWAIKKSYSYSAIVVTFYSRARTQTSDFSRNSEVWAFSARQNSEFFKNSEFWRLGGLKGPILPNLPFLCGSHRAGCAI